MRSAADEIVEKAGFLLSYTPCAVAQLQRCLDDQALMTKLRNANTDSDDGGGGGIADDADTTTIGSNNSSAVQPSDPVDPPRPPILVASKTVSATSSVGLLTPDGR